MLVYDDVKKMRLKYDISQTKLSEFSGFSKAQISAWELGKRVPVEAEIIKLNDVLKETVSRIKQGTLNVKKKKVQHHQVEKKLPSTIKDAKEYKRLSKDMKYSGSYSNELSNLYKDAMSPKGAGAIKGIALFSGCGGMTLGFEAAGVNLLGHVEIEESANRIYAENFPESRLLGKDICKITDEDLCRWKEEFGDIDIIVGGPPCQGFSLAGKRNPQDERNKLYKQYVRIVSIIRPKVFVMENVALMTSMKDEQGKLFIDKIEKAFSEQDYSIVKKTVNAYEYGVPQSRERIILIGVRNDKSDGMFHFRDVRYSLEDETRQLSLWGNDKKKALTFRDATHDLQSVESGEQSLNDPLHWSVAHPEHVIRWLKDVPEGHSAHENKNLHLRPPSGFNTTYKRNIWDEPCSTISTNFSMISGCRNVHPVNTRALTIREAARIQSFPDEFVFCGNWGDIRKAIGNAVPPILAREIASEILEQIF
ncbi:MAG: DNA (cytosine-5-)-methyltransferase [Lachnospiraceae bacterium]|nr:DNA (cytosine-5-)-methyltransferase [Lachnospiraceae bacterium]